jgi:hypothetical protein
MARGGFLDLERAERWRCQSLQEMFSRRGPSWMDSLHLVKTGKTVRREGGERGRGALVQRPVTASAPSMSWMASAARERRGDGKLETMTWREGEERAVGRMGAADGHVRGERKEKEKSGLCSLVALRYTAYKGKNKISLGQCVFCALSQCPALNASTAPRSTTGYPISAIPLD